MIFSTKMLIKCCLIFFLSVNLRNVESKIAPKTVQDLVYPKARRDVNVVDDYHGTKIVDPYRWMEDPDSAETRQYVEDANKVTQPFLENSDQWRKIKEELTGIWDYPKYTVLHRHGKYYFTHMNTGLQNQDVLYKQETLESEPTVFLDPNPLSSDGTIALDDISFSHDGSLLAYCLSESGSDWMTIKIRDVETGDDYPDMLEKVKFTSMTWTHDNKGLFYCHYPDQLGNPDGSGTDTNLNQKLYYHRVGQNQSEDILVVEFTENPSWQMAVQVSDSGKYLIVMVEKDNRNNLIYFADLDKTGEINGKLDLTPVITKFEADYHYITNNGSKAVFRTDKKAPNYRLITIDLTDYAEEKWTTLVAEDPKDVLDWAVCVDNDKIMIGYLHDVKSVLQAHSLNDGKLIRQFPTEIGTIDRLGGSKKNSEVFYQLESFLTPGTIYKYDFATPDVEPSVYREVKFNLPGFDKRQFTVEQVFYASRDGTKIPMFIIQKKSESNESRPCLLYGYGGFNISWQPMFSTLWLYFMEAFNGIVAIPNIRGGGEYGEKWHNAGRLLNKQNSYDDFQAAAEYLVQNKYAEAKKIAIQGASNGGLLVGVCINQRPELYGAAVAQVGVMDMLRFNKFTIGHAWMSEFGNPSEVVHFNNLIKFSPLHNVHSPANESNQYPSTLILTGDHDDRVSPLHSLKFAATLHHAVKDNQNQKNPILLRVYSKAGHGDGKPTQKKIEECADILTFLYRAIDVNASL